MADGDATSNTKYCSNCQRQIGSENFMMHELHCQRNIVLCKQCNEPIKRSQMKEHEEQMHSSVKCTLCSEEMEISKLSLHEEQLCTKRNVKCSICEIETPFDQYEEHLNYCESRTQECEKCHQYIMMKDWEVHETSNCQLPEVVRRNSESLVVDGSSFASGDAPAYIRESSFVNKELDRIFNHPHGSFSTMNYGDEVGLASVDYPSLVSDRTMLPCEFCNSLFPSEVILAHQASCPRDPSSGRVNDQLASMLNARMSFNLRSGEIIDRSMEESDDDTFDTLPDGEDSSVILPCEFCEELFPMSQLPTHQVMCPRDELRSARGERSANDPKPPERIPYIPDPPRETQLEDFMRPTAVRRYIPGSSHRTSDLTSDIRDGEVIGSHSHLTFESGMWPTGSHSIPEYDRRQMASDTLQTSMGRTRGPEGQNRASRSRNPNPDPATTRRPPGARLSGPPNSQGRGQGSARGNGNAGRRGGRGTRGRQSRNNQ